MSLGAIGAGLSAFAGARERRLEREARETELAKRETERAADIERQTKKDAADREWQKEALGIRQKQVADTSAATAEYRNKDLTLKQNADARAQQAHDAAMAKQDEAQEADMSEEDADFIRTAYGAYALQAGQSQMALQAFNKGIPEDSPKRVVAIYNQEWNYENGQPIALKLADGTERFIKSSEAADALAHRARKHGYAGPKVTGGEELPPVSAADRQEILDTVGKFYRLPTPPSGAAARQDPNLQAEYESRVNALIAAMQRGDSAAEAASLARMPRIRDGEVATIEEALSEVNSQIKSAASATPGISSQVKPEEQNRLMDLRNQLMAQLKAKQGQDPATVRWQKANTPQFRRTPTGMRQVGPPTGPAPSRGIAARAARSFVLNDIGSDRGSAGSWGSSMSTDDGPPIGFARLSS